MYYVRAIVWWAMVVSSVVSLLVWLTSDWGAPGWHGFLDYFAGGLFNGGEPMVFDESRVPAELQEGYQSYRSGRSAGIGGNLVLLIVRFVVAIETYPSRDSSNG